MGSEMCIRDSFIGERPRITQLVGALIAFCGMALVAYKLESKATLIGFMLVIIASMCWATGNIVTKKIGRVNPLALMIWGSLISLPPLLIASLLMEGTAGWIIAAHNMNWRAFATVLYQAYPNTMFAFGAWAVLMRKYPAATVAPFTLLVPIIGMICAALILDEALQWWKLLVGWCWGDWRLISLGRGGWIGVGCFKLDWPSGIDGLCSFLA